jgi:hypothetical protein
MYAAMDFGDAEAQPACGVCGEEGNGSLKPPDARQFVTSRACGVEVGGVVVARVASSAASFTR